MNSYIDWSKIPEGYDYACIGDPENFYSNPYIRVYSQKPKIKMFAFFEDWYTQNEKRFLPGKDVIIGKIPYWRDSLLVRP